MKTYSTFTILLFSSLVYDQNVMIGTATPTEELHINGTTSEIGDKMGTKVDVDGEWMVAGAPKANVEGVANRGKIMIRKLE